MTHPSELQVQIDDVYACPGSCGGCVLLATERKHKTPDMSPEIMDKAIERLIEYVKARPQLDRLNITFGIADHLLMLDDYIHHIYKLGAKLIKAANPRDKSHSAVFFSTALIAKKDRIFPRLDTISSFAKGSDIPLIPVVVFDPVLQYSSKFGNDYREIILKTKELFGKVDLSINLSDPAISHISAEDLHNFAADNGFDEMTINWSPTPDNLERTTPDMAKLTKWLLAFDKKLQSENRISSSFRPVILRSIDAVMCANEGHAKDIPYAKTITALIPETVRRSIQIDHNGELFPKFEAIGDVPHSPRFGYKSLGNICDTPLITLIEDGIPTIERRAIAAHAHCHDCASCDHAAICAATGFHILNHVFKKNTPTINHTHCAKDSPCPHVARALFNHFMPISSRRSSAAQASAKPLAGLQSQA